MELTDEQWSALEPCFPDRELGPPGPKGGRPFKDTREVLNGVLWVLKTGARWEDLPRRYPPYQTCHRRYQEWVKSGVLERALKLLAEDLRDRGKVDLTEAYIDGAPMRAPKGGRSCWENSPWQGDQDHGSGRRQRSSYRRWDCEWSAR